MVVIGPGDPEDLGGLQPEVELAGRKAAITSHLSHRRWLSRIHSRHPQRRVLSHISAIFCIYPCDSADSPEPKP
jgi:hypothetical protein